MKFPEIMKKPAVIGIIAGIVGIILGLVWAWGIQPVQWTDASPAFLASRYKDEYLRMAIDSYKVNPDNTVAFQRYQAVGENGIDVLRTIASTPGQQDPMAIMGFITAVQPGGLSATNAETAGGTIPSGNPAINFLIIGMIVLVVAVIGYLMARLLRPMIRKNSERTPVQQSQEITRNTETTDFSIMNDDKPVFQMMNTYVLGDDLYTHSMDVNSADGTYLGQCGLEISDTVPVFDKPKRVRAIGVWLFGLRFKETTWAILMPPEAYENESLRDRLRVKGEPIKVEPNLVIEIETQELKMHVRIVKAEYGQGAAPEDDYYKNLTLELAVWPKVVAPE